MNRTAAVLLLAGATFIAAQATTDQDGGKGFREGIDLGAHVKMDSMRHIPKWEGLDTAWFDEKFRDAMENWKSKRDSTREARREFREHLRDSLKLDSARVVTRHRNGKLERIQGAIDALERIAERLGSQVNSQTERIQARLLERRDELIELQQRIKERKEQIGKKTETTEGETEAAE